MTRAFKMLTFQAATLATAGLMMSTVAAMSRAAPAPAAAQVAIANFTFKAPVTTVKAGTTVTWTNADDIPHTVVSKDGLFKSKVLDHRRPLHLHFRQSRTIRLLLFPAPAHDGNHRRQGVRHGTGRSIVKTSAPVLFARRAAAATGSAPGAHPPGAGHAHDFRQLILPHLDGAYNLARYLTRDPVLSEDVVQDAMLRAFRAFAQFRGGSARAWLFTIVRNCSRTAMSGKRGVVSLVINESSLGDEAAAQVGEHPDPGPSPEEELFRKMDAVRVRAAIEIIPEPFREVVVLRDLEDLSYAEIAEVTGVPVGTVMSRLSRGRGILATELLPAGKDDGEQSRSVK